MVREDDEKYRNNLLKGFKGNPKGFYGFMRGVKSVKDNVTGLNKADGSLTETDKEAAEELASCIQRMLRGKSSSG